jgi:uncharacterized protein YjfI (DUF2170 family)
MKDARAKSSTEYVREFRERMRRAGLVKKDVWIRPERASELAAFEKRLREPAEAAGEADPDRAFRGWTVASLGAALLGSRPVQEGRIGVEVLDGAEPSLHLVMHDFGDLPVFVAIGAEQITVEALMWPVDDVVDPAAFNAHVLRTHKMLPLSTLGIEPIAGRPCYIMFGSLGPQSTLPQVLFEIETLADNVLAAADAYAPFLRPDVLEGLAA